MKKITTTVILIIMIFALFGCKSKDSAEEQVFTAKKETVSSAADKTDSTPPKTETDIKEDDNEAVTEKEPKPDNKENNTDIQSVQKPSAVLKPDENTDTAGNEVQTPDDSFKTDSTPADKTQQSAESKGDMSVGSDFVSSNTPPYADTTFKTAAFYESDTFLATVLTSKKVDRPLVFFNFSSGDGYVMHTVRVEKVYRGTFVTEGTVITVFYNAHPEFENYWSNPYENGEKYIISGIVQPYNNAPVVVDGADLSAHIANDGTLTPLSFLSKAVLGQFKTLEDFENDSASKEFFESEWTEIVNVFSAFGEEYHELSEKDRDTEVYQKHVQFIEDIKNALPIDSKIDLTLKYKNISDPTTLEDGICDY